MTKKIRKLTVLGLTIMLMLSCVEKDQVPDKESPTAAVFVVYVFEATMNGKYEQYPILPGETAIWTWEKVIENAEEYKDRLKKVYTYEEYKLLQTLRESYFYQNGEWSKGSEEPLHSHQKWINVYPVSNIIEQRLSFFIKIDKGEENGKHSVRIAGKSGETTVLGTPWKVPDKPERALFVAVTPFYVQLANASHYEEFIGLYSKAVSLTPGQPGFTGHRLFARLNAYYEEKFSKKNLIDADTLAPKSLQQGTPEEEPAFVEYDQPPQPVGGFDLIQKNLVYPESARKAGIEGRVFVNVQIDEQGNVTEARIAKSIDPDGCDKAALWAVSTVKWKPAIRDGKPVKVWIIIPIQFTLQ